VNLGNTTAHLIFTTMLSVVACRINGEDCSLAPDFSPIYVTVYFTGGEGNGDVPCGTSCAANGPYYLTLNCFSDSGWTSLVAKAGFVSAPGYVTIYAEYDPADTKCTGNPTFVAYTALGVCTPDQSSYQGAQKYFIYSADASGTVYVSTYYDSACTLPTTPLNVKTSLLNKYATYAPATCASGGTNGGQLTRYKYSAQAPDAFIKANATLPAGALIGRRMQYKVGDTTCANTPVYLSTSPMQTCLALPSASFYGSGMFISDVSGTVYQRNFITSPTCTLGKGLTSISKYTSTTCVATAAGPLSTWKIIKPLSPSLTSLITSTVGYVEKTS